LCTATVAGAPYCAPLIKPVAAGSAGLAALEAAAGAMAGEPEHVTSGVLGVTLFGVTGGLGYVRDAPLDTADVFERWIIGGWAVVQEAVTTIAGGVHCHALDDC